MRPKVFVMFLTMFGVAGSARHRFVFREVRRAAAIKHRHLDLLSDVAGKPPMC